MTKICRLNIPSAYFGKRELTRKGAIRIVNTVKSADIKIPR